MKSKIVLAICALALPLAAATVATAAHKKGGKPHHHHHHHHKGKACKGEFHYFKAGKCQDFAQEEVSARHSQQTAELKSPAGALRRGFEFLSRAARRLMRARGRPPTEESGRRARALACRPESRRAGRR